MADGAGVKLAQAPSYRMVHSYLISLGYVAPGDRDGLVRVHEKGLQGHDVLVWAYGVRFACSHPNNLFLQMNAYWE